MHDPVFENAILMLQCEKEDHLIVEQQNSLEISELDIQSSLLEDSTKLFLTDHARKRIKLKDSPSSKKHLDTRFITPTSNICEQIFFACKIRNW